MYVVATVAMNGKAVALAKPDVLPQTYENGSHTLSFIQTPDTKTPLKGQIGVGIYNSTLCIAFNFTSVTDLKISGTGLGRCIRKVVRPDSKKSLPRTRLC